MTAITDYGHCRSVNGDDLTSIRKGQCYYLVSKHSDDWWIIRHPDFENDVYVPADYVEEIGQGLSPRSVLENNDSAFITNDENHNYGEPQYANLETIQGHIHGDKVMLQSSIYLIALMVLGKHFSIFVFHWAFKVHLLLDRIAPFIADERCYQQGCNLYRVL